MYIKLRHNRKKLHEQKAFYFQFYILCANFRKIGSLIKIIIKFVNDPLKKYYFVSCNIIIFLLVEVSKIYKNIDKKCHKNIDNDQVEKDLQGAMKFVLALLDSKTIHIITIEGNTFYSYWENINGNEVITRKIISLGK